jgi:hypothetical protein
MWAQERNWGSQRGVRFLDSANVGVNVAVQRIKLLELGLSVIDKLPLCSPSEAVNLGEFLPRAKEGFSLAIKADRFNRGQLKDILRITTPQAVLGIWNNLSLSDRENTLPEYAQAVATLSILHSMGNVSFYSFEDSPNDISYGAGVSESKWYYNTDAEGIWTLLNELDGLTRTLLHGRWMSSDDMLKAGHFYSASRESAKIFS